MKTLRHPPLLFWVVVLLALAAVVVSSRGDDGSGVRLPTAASTTRDERADVMYVMQRAAAMNAVAAGAAGELRTWANGFADEVAQVKARNPHRPAGIASAYDAVIAAARTLGATDPQDAEAVLRAKTETSLAVLALQTAVTFPAFSTVDSPSQ